LTDNIALLGGSFDPVHNGHIQAAAQIRKKLDLDKVFLVPNHRNPLKSDIPQAPPEKRLEMIRLAAGQVEGIEVSSVEIERKKPSYTVDTLRMWKGTGKHALWLVIGHDLFANITKWKDFRDIFEISNVAIVSRAGMNFTIKPEPPFEIRNDFLYHKEENEMICFNHSSGSKLLFVKIDAPDISSTEIRKRVKEGRSFENLVPPPVADFIKREKLYSEEPPR